jgi:chemotaxis protein CheX
MIGTSVTVPADRIDSDHLLVEFWMLPFPAAAEHVFPTMLDSACVAGTPERKSAGHRMHDVTSVIGLSGFVTGSIAFSVTREASMAILERMTGIQAAEVDELVCDCVGEMANMIAGRAKIELAPFELALGLPQVINGHDYSLVSPRWTIHEWLPLKTDLGDCALEVCFDLAPLRSLLRG